MDIFETLGVAPAIGGLCKILVDIIKGEFPDLPFSRLLLPLFAFLLGFGLSAIWAVKQNLEFNKSGLATIALWGLGAGGFAILMTEVHKKVRKPEAVREK